MMAKSPAERFASLAEVVTALEGLFAGENAPVAAPSVWQRLWSWCGGIVASLTRPRSRAAAPAEVDPALSHTDAAPASPGTSLIDAAPAEVDPALSHTDAAPASPGTSLTHAAPESSVAQQEVQASSQTVELPSDQGA
jgi:hypothetical protein